MSPEERVGRLCLEDVIQELAGHPFEVLPLDQVGCQVWSQVCARQWAC